MLRKLIPVDPRGAIHFSDHFEGEGAELFKRACAAVLKPMKNKLAEQLRKEQLAEARKRGREWLAGFTVR
jgi:hypothetical protein